MASALSRLAVLLAIEMSDERQAVLAEYLASKGYTEDEIRQCCRRIADDDELSRQIRIHGALVPADFTAAYKRLYGGRTKEEVERRRQKMRQEEERFRQLGPMPERHVQVEAPRLTSRDEQRRRLQRGTDLPERGTPAYAESWAGFYGLDYVGAAQEKAREQLQTLPKT